MGERKGVYKVLVGKPKEKRLLGRPRRRWEDCIKRDFQEVRCGVWTGSSWLKMVAGTCECSNELSGSVKCGEFLG
jgi:hypothetical protein